jgi:hypothetical protein
MMAIYQEHIDKNGGIQNTEYLQSLHSLALDDDATIGSHSGAIIDDEKPFGNNIMISQEFGLQTTWPFSLVIKELLHKYTLTLLLG